MLRNSPLFGFAGMNHGERAQATWEPKAVSDDRSCPQGDLQSLVDLLERALMRQTDRAEPCHGRRN